MENQMTNVTEQSPTTTNQNEPPRTPVLQQKTNGNVEVNDSDITADHVMGGAAGGELAAEPGSEQVQVQQKRRGRPRKCDSDGKFQSCESSTKKNRGRPRGSGRLQLQSSMGAFVDETAGGNFSPHVLTVRIGEDVMGRIASFSQRGSQSFCMIAATGAVSSVMLALSAGSTMTFEGRFEILSFSGAYIYTYGGIGGAQNRKGAFSVLLAKPDGNVFGGCVEGQMIAAATIQLIVGSFKQNLSKQMRRKGQGEGSSTRKQPAGNPDAAKQEANIIEDEQKCASPTSELMPTTTTSTINGVADNVTPVIVCQNMHPPAAALNGVVGLEALDGEALKPILDHINGVQGI